MWRSPLFWRLFAAFGTLLLAALGSLGWILIPRIENQLLEQIRQTLELKTLLLRDLVARIDKAELQGQMKRLGQETSTRITLIAADGVVLADSSEDPGNMENHKDRPEVREAAQDGVGVATRFSGTVHEPMMYFARRITGSEHGAAYVRVALPLTEVQRQTATLRHLVWGAMGLSATLTVLLALYFARRMTLPLRQLSRGATAIAAGEYGHKVYLDRQDEIGAVASSFNDMSQRLADQFAQLDQDRHQLRAVLGSMVEGVIAIDGEQTILFANDRAGQLLDFSVPQAVGRKLWEVIRVRPVHNLVKQLLVRGSAETVTLDGAGLAPRSVTVHAAPLPGDPVGGAVLVFHDVSELRRLERLRQDFVANVSHELKTPLSVIVACVETLQSGALEDIENRGKFLERIAAQAQRLLTLIVDLLNLARIESGTEEFTPEELPIADAVAACIERHQERARAKNQRLEAVPPARVPDRGVIAWADADALSHILDNLVDNAIKYTPPDGTIQLSWWADDGKAAIEVRDNGIGIPESELPRVFERFHRVDKARSRELGGTGLGLSIVKHLTQALGGSIQASSRPGQGSAFVVSLPVRPN